MIPQINFLILLLYANYLSGQTPTLNNKIDFDSGISSQNGVEAVLMLQEGTLIIRLYSFQEKINYLEKIKGKDIADAEKAKIDFANKAIIQEFSEDYDFSKVLYTYGKELDQFLQNKKMDIFLNENLDFDPSIKVNEGPIFILASKSTTHFNVYDINLTPIEKPSLKYICHHLDSKFQSGVSEMTQGFREILTSKATANKLNKRLHSIAKANQSNFGR